MTAPATEKTALEYLAASKLEQEASNHHKAAALMWQATQATFAALAQAHGLKYKGLMIAICSKSPMPWNRTERSAKAIIAAASLPALC